MTLRDLADYVGSLFWLGSHAVPHAHSPHAATADSFALDGGPARAMPETTQRRGHAVLRPAEAPKSKSGAEVRRLTGEELHALYAQDMIEDLDRSVQYALQHPAVRPPASILKEATRLLDQLKRQFALRHFEVEETRYVAVRRKLSGRNSLAPNNPYKVVYNYPAASASTDSASIVVANSDVTARTYVRVELREEHKFEVSAVTAAG